MEYEHPEKPTVRIHHHGGQQDLAPDGEIRHGFDEPTPPEDRRERRGDNLW
jgi:hypothetical protein